MPTKKSKLGEKYGAKANAAVQSHAEDETTYGFIPLPPGIPNGIAQLQKLYFEQYEKGDNKGEYYMRGVGVVLEPIDPVPTKAGPMIVKGLTTSIMVPFCETTFGSKTTSQEEHIQTILLEMRRLGGPEYTAGATIDDLEDLAAGLEELAPIFKFSTQARIAQQDVPTKGVKKGDVLDGCFENWHGTQGLEDYVPPESKKVTVRGGAGSQEVSSPNGEKLKHGEEKVMNRSKPVERAAEPLTPDPDDNVEDLDALAADAEDSDSNTAEESGNKLIELGLELGLEEKWMRKDAANWDEVVTAIRDGREKLNENPADPDQPPDEPGDYKPAKGDEVGYHPLDARTKKRVAKPVKCTITSVNERKETVNLKSGKAEYKDIEWNELVPLEVPSE